MPLTVGDLVAYLTVDDSKYNASIDKAGTRFQQLGDKTRGAGIAMSAAVSVPILAMALSAGKGAAAVEQGVMKANTVFGESVGVVQDWATKNSSAMGMTAKGAAGLAANFGDLLIPMGFTRTAAADMATKTVGLAGALSAWTGGTRTAAEVSDILAKAMLGEREGLKELGISILDADVQARLLKKGQQDLTGAALEQAKAIATQELIFEKSTDAQKAFGDSTETLAEKQLKTTAAMAKFKETIGTALVPIVSALGGALAKVANFFSNLPGPVQKVLLVIAGIIAVVGPLLLLIGPIATAFSALAVVIPIVAGAFTLLLGPVGLVILAIAAIGAAVYLVIKYWDEIKAAMAKVWEVIQEAVAKAWEAILGALKWAWEAIKKAFEWYIGLYIAIPKAAWEAIQGAVAAAWQLILDALNIAWEAIKTAFWTYVEGWKTIISSAWAFIEGAVAAAWQLILDALNAAWELVKTAFWTYVEGWKTIISEAWEAIRGAVAGAWDLIKTALKTAWGLIASWFGELPAKGVALIGAIWTQIKDAVAGAWNLIKTALSDAVSKVWDTIAQPFRDAWLEIKRIWGQIAGLFNFKGGTVGGVPVTDIPGVREPGSWDGGMDTLPTREDIFERWGLDSAGGPLGGWAASGGSLAASTRRVQQIVFGMFRGAVDMGGYATSGHVVGSDHYTGHAFDVGGSFGTMQAIANMLVGGLGSTIKYLIFNREINTGGGWRAYHGVSPHINHVHVSTYQTGGIVPGSGPVPIIAHGGERVLDTRQTSLFERMVAALEKGRGGGNTINVTGAGAVDIGRQVAAALRAV